MCYKSLLQIHSNVNWAPNWWCSQIISWSKNDRIIYVKFLIDYPDWMQLPAKLSCKRSLRRICWSWVRKCSVCARRRWSATTRSFSSQWPLKVGKLCRKYFCENVYEQCSNSNMTLLMWFPHWCLLMNCIALPEPALISERKKLIRGPTVHLISSVPINAKAVLQSIEDLKPLVDAMPADPNERKRYVETSRNKRPKLALLWKTNIKHLYFACFPAAIKI